MRLSDLIFQLFRFLLIPAVIGTLYLYLYPPLIDCSFPLAKRAQAGCTIPGKQKDAVPGEIAPFRLLALGDPQLEGDTSLPDTNAPLFPSLDSVSNGDLGSIGSALGELLKGDLPRLFQGYRKRLDLWGNDLYLAHIYRSVTWWTDPTHTVVLGDILGSQWIGDEEFKRRSDRFWNRVVRGTEKVPRAVTESSGRTEVLGQDESWRKRVIAVAGNHDIGYAGDIDEGRIERFEDAFGSVNWGITFTLNNTNLKPLKRHIAKPTTVPPKLHLILLNSMNLDSPAKNSELQQQSRDIAMAQFQRTSEDLSGRSATILLTHIPLHKEEGVCSDGPFFDWFSTENGGGLKEQNHLTKDTSDYILNGLTRSGGHERVIVLNGHDHEGCDTYHSFDFTSLAKKDEDPESGSEESHASAWKARPYQIARPRITTDDLVGVREITVRSMMGSFGGNAGFLSAWFDADAGEWNFEYSSCMLGIQHIWWAVHVLDLVVLGIGIAGLVTLGMEEMGGTRSEVSRVKVKKA